ncbi:MAG: hypothetical protein ACXVZ1_05605 [Gaiellaceae bacterium]
MLDGLKLRRLLVVQISAGAVTVLGLTVFVGWLLNVDILKRALPNLLAMKVDTAFMFIAAGAGLWAIARETPPIRRRLLASLGGGWCILLSGLTLVEYAWRNLGIDQLLFHDATGGADPGRPSPHTAVAFVLVGANLILLARGRSRLAAWTNNALALVVGAGVIGYAYHVDYLRGIHSVNGIALSTLVGMVVLVVGLAAASPGSTWLGVFVAPDAGGRMARRFAPVALLAPILIGLQASLYERPVGRAVAALVVCGASVVMLIAGATALDRAEAQRKVLGGLLPICAHCKRIRDDQGYWNQIEAYVTHHSEAEFSHSVCPSCFAELYPNLEESQRN